MKKQGFSTCVLCVLKLAHNMVKNRIFTETWNIVTKLPDQTKFEEPQPELKHILPVWPD